MIVLSLKLLIIKHRNICCSKKSANVCNVYQRFNFCYFYKLLYMSEVPL